MSNQRDEERVFQCKWISGSGSEFKCTLVNNSRIIGVGLSENDACNDLMVKLQKKYKSYFNVLTFINSLSNPGRHYLRIIGDESFDLIDSRLDKFNELDLDEYIQIVQDYYTKPVCNKCFSSYGKRTERQIEIDYVSMKYDGCFGFIGRRIGWSRQHILISADLKDIFERHKENKFKFRKVICKKRELYEIESDDYVPFVCPWNLKPNGWECGSCKRQTFGFYIKDSNIRDYLPYNVVKNNLDFFMAGSVHGPSLIVSNEWWEKHATMKGLKGYSIREVGLSKKYLLRPKLEKRYGKKKQIKFIPIYQFKNSAQQVVRL